MLVVNVSLLIRFSEDTWGSRVRDCVSYISNFDDEEWSTERNCAEYAWNIDWLFSTLCGAYT